jgi:hypothetical protein
MDNIERAIATGYANGDVHLVTLQPRQNHSEAAALEMEGIGKLTNAGFRTVVASLWCNAEKKTASVDFVAIWEENGVAIIVKHGDRVATSHELYTRWKMQPDDPMTASEMIAICRKLTGQS